MSAALTIDFEYHAAPCAGDLAANDNEILPARPRLVHVETVGGDAVSYIPGPTGTLARISYDNSMAYLHNDHLGSATALSNDNGDVYCQESYTPFGETMRGPACNDNQGGFTGHIKDKATGLNPCILCKSVFRKWPFFVQFLKTSNIIITNYTVQARYYDPNIGRFLSVDPVTFLDKPYPGQFNRYAYTWNDPINANDPDGEFLNFVAKFAADVVLEVAIQAATGQEIDVGSALVGAATGLVDPTKTARKVARLGGALNDARKTRRAVSSKPCPICFTAGTLVDTEAGLRPIEDIKVGERVWAWDEETGVTALKTVTHTVPYHERIIWNVTFQDLDGGTVTIETTDEHPWWIIGQGWIETKDLQANTIAKTRDNRGLKIISVINTGRTEGTYNISVADYETYFVGENKILVHNCGGEVQGPPKVEVTETNTIRSGANASTQLKVTEANGNTKDITRNRVKAKTPNNHPSAPAGTMNRVKFDNSQPGTKGFKRDPTPSEIQMIDNVER